MSEDQRETDAPPASAPTGDPDAALARLAKMKDAEPESSKPTPYWLGLLVLAGVAAFLTIFPALLDGGATDDQRFQEALGYCKYRDDKDACEDRIEARYELCVERAEKANKPNADRYGQCMMEEFPDFYLTAGWNKR